MSDNASTIHPEDGVVPVSVLQPAHTWEGIYRELRKMFGDRHVAMQRFPGEMSGQPVSSLQLPMHIAADNRDTVLETLLTDGAVGFVSDEKSMDDVGFVRDVMIVDATYAVHWLGKDEDVVVYVSYVYRGAALMNDVRKALTAS